VYFAYQCRCWKMCNIVSRCLQKLAAVVRHVSSRADVEAVAALAGDAATSAVIMDAVDWQSIPAENLVAAFQVQPSPACLTYPANCMCSEAPDDMFM
jgi:3-dehydroquinate synthase class II